MRVLSSCMLPLSWQFVNLWASSPVLAQVPEAHGVCVANCQSNSSSDDDRTKAIEERIGNAGIVVGDVFLVGPPGSQSIRVTPGMPIPFNSHITTGPTGHFQVLLTDETVFTLGPSADMVLDEFVYDPHVTARKVVARIVKGLFRFVTAKVPRHEPDHLSIGLAVGNIGIRGTDVEVFQDVDGSGWIKLHTGAAFLTPYSGSSDIEMTGPAMIKYDLTGRITGPLPLTDTY